MVLRKQRPGLLAHSAKAGEERREFMAMRLSRLPASSNGEQLHYFLFNSRAGVSCIVVFAAIFFCFAEVYLTRRWV